MRIAFKNNWKRDHDGMSVIHYWQTLVGFNLASVSKFIADTESASESETSSTMSVLSDPAAESGQQVLKYFFIKTFLTEQNGWPAVQARVLQGVGSFGRSFIE